MKKLLTILGTFSMIGSATVPAILTHNNSYANETKENHETFLGMSYYSFTTNQPQVVYLNGGTEMLNNLAAMVINQGITNGSLSNFNDKYECDVPECINIYNSWPSFTYKNLLEIIGSTNFVSFKDYYMVTAFDENNTDWMNATFYLTYTTSENSTQVMKLGTREKMFNYTQAIGAVWTNTLSIDLNW